eukprot:5079989-Prymnesium_polylepis.2
MRRSSSPIARKGAGASRVSAGHIGVSIELALDLGSAGCVSGAPHALQKPCAQSARCEHGRMRSAGRAGRRVAVRCQTRESKQVRRRRDRACRTPGPRYRAAKGACCSTGGRRGGSSPWRVRGPRARATGCAGQTCRPARLQAGARAPQPHGQWRRATCGTCTFWRSVQEEKPHVSEVKSQKCVAFGGGVRWRGCKGTVRGCARGVALTDRLVHVRIRFGIDPDRGERRSEPLLASVAD